MEKTLCEGARAMSIAVRQAGTADAGAIAGLFGQLGYPSAAADVASRMAQAGSDCVTLVAHDGAAVLGVLVLNVFAPLHVPARWAVVSALVVDERVRSTGAGALLLAAAEAEAVQRHCDHIELSCSEQRPRAHAFYEAQGFTERRKRFVKTLPAA